MGSLALDRDSDEELGPERNASQEEKPPAEATASKDASYSPMGGVDEGQAEEPCSPNNTHSELPEAKPANVTEERELGAGSGERSEREAEGALQFVKESSEKGGNGDQLEEATSMREDESRSVGDEVEEPESGPSTEQQLGGREKDSRDQQLGGSKQDSRDRGKQGSIHDRLGPRGAESSDWRRGKRGRNDDEADERLERSERRNGPNSSNGDAGRKRRKSGDSKAALALSPVEKRFRMGAIDESRGSPKVGRDRRRERYQPPRAVNEEDQRATLYVGDIEQATSKRDLRRAFERFGEIKEAKMITNQCYGFVTFRLRSDAESALESAGSVEILGRKPYVSWAQGAMPAWKIGVGGFVMDPSSGIIDKRDALTKAAEVAAGVAAAAVRAKQKAYEESVQKQAGGRSIVAYDDLF